MPSLSCRKYIIITFKPPQNVGWIQFAKLLFAFQNFSINVDIQSRRKCIWGSERGWNSSAENTALIITTTYYSTWLTENCLREISFHWIPKPTSRVSSSSLYRIHSFPYMYIQRYLLLPKLLTFHQPHFLFSLLLYAISRSSIALTFWDIQHPLYRTAGRTPVDTWIHLPVCVLFLIFS